MLGALLRLSCSKSNVCYAVYSGRENQIVESSLIGISIVGKVLSHCKHDPRVMSDLVI